MSSTENIKGTFLLYIYIHILEVGIPIHTWQAKMLNIPLQNLTQACQLAQTSKNNVPIQNPTRENKMLSDMILNL